MSDDDNPDDSGDLLLKAPVELATAEIDCWKCKRSMQAVALVARLEDADAVPESGNSSVTEEAVFIASVGEEGMPTELETQLSELAPNYLPRYSRTMGETTWANVCPHCDALQGEFFLHSEPDGPFSGGPSNFQGHRIPLSVSEISISDDCSIYG